jgi:sugar phosphate isomerase/epimerase
MRFGFCGNLVAKGPCGTGIEIVEKIAEYGYDYIELPIAEMSALPYDKFKEYVRRVEAAGIRWETSNNFFPASQRLTGPDVNDDAVERYFNLALDRAHEAGVETVVFGSYAAKKVPEGFSFEKAYEQLVVLHKKVGVAARARGIMIAIEPTRTPLTNIIITYEDGVKLAKIVDDDNIKVLIDNYHMDAEGEDPAILTRYPEYLRHVHFSYPNLANPKVDRLVPVSESEWDYQPLRKALSEAKYHGRMSIEAATPDFEVAAKQALALMQKLFV